MSDFLTIALSYAIVLAAAGIPAISVRFVAMQYFEAARDVWLYALGWIAAAMTFAVSVPLGFMACAVMLRWRSWEQLPAVATWAGIIATWVIVQHLPTDVAAFLPMGWRLVLLLLIGMAIAQRWNGYEVKATTGSRVLLAGLLALVWPFTQWIEWPFYAVGFWLTSSWIALAALLVAIAIMHPWLAPGILVAAVVIVLLFAIRSTRVLLIDRTPRGGSLDGLRMRLRTWAAMIRLTAQWPWWVTGWGPSPASRLGGHSLERELEREEVRMVLPPHHDRDRSMGGQPQALASSPTHCEPLELACTYGLLAVLAMAIFAWQLQSHILLGDAWSASALAGLVLALATIPARAAPVGVLWLIVLAVVMRQ
jgi:hypothetical protein